MTLTKATGKFRLATFNGISVGKINEAGELIACHWGTHYSTGLYPEIARKYTHSQRNVWSETRKPACEIKAAQHHKAAKNGESLCVLIIGDKALVEINTEIPRVVTLPEAREIWKQS